MANHYQPAICICVDCKNELRRDGMQLELKFRDDLTCLPPLSGRRTFGKDTKGGDKVGKAPWRGPRTQPRASVRALPRKGYFNVKRSYLFSLPRGCPVLQHHSRALRQYSAATMVALRLCSGASRAVLSTRCPASKASRRWASILSLRKHAYLPYLRDEPDLRSARSSLSFLRKQLG